MRIDIYMSCPRCFAEGHNTARQWWLHRWPCGGVLTLDESAVVRCGKCTAKGDLKDMTLKCQEGIHKYSVSTLEGYAAAISTSAHFVNGGGITWLQGVLRNL